jgi:hypothetical protein
MFCLLTLPLHLALGVLFLPFLLIRVFIKMLVALIMIPVALLAGALSIGIGLLIVGLLLAIPLTPFIVIGLFVWAIVRLTSRPVYVR